MTQTLLERIEELVGTIIAYDGRLAFWTKITVHDVRDIAPRLNVHLSDVMAAMPVFERAKRGRKSASITLDDEGNDAN